MEGYRYTGLTENINIRIKQHNDKSLSFRTKRGTNWKVAYSEIYFNKSDALKREKWLKTGAGRQFVNKILNR